MAQAIIYILPVIRQRYVLDVVIINKDMWGGQQQGGYGQYQES